MERLCKRRPFGNYLWRSPYLVSRYDTTTGEQIPIEKRIGLLERKLRIINENIDNSTEWLKWA